MKKFISLAATSLIFLLISNTASAVPIDGRIDFTGSGTVAVSGNTISTLAFDNPYIFVVANPTLVTGSFTGLQSTLATFSNFDASAPTGPLWSAGDFSFTITSVLTNVFDSTFKLSGAGIISSLNPGLDDTEGTWVITGNGGAAKVSFSSTTVPAPAGTALLGLCLLGFGLARRNKKA